MGVISLGLQRGEPVLIPSTQALRYSDHERLFAVQQMQFLARLEAHGFAGGNGYLGSGSRIAADSGFSGADVEDTEAPQLDSLAASQGLLETLEDGVDGGFGLHAGQTGPLDDVVDDVLFNQCLHPKTRLFPQIPERWCDARKLFEHCQRIRCLVRCNF
jgi:hypothetical protein